MQENKQEKSPIKQKILLYLERKGITQYEFYKNTGVTRGVLGQKNGISEENLARFLAYYKDVNIECFAIALELNLDETRDLVARAGYALSASSKFDVIIEYFIRQKKYDIFEINEALFAFDQSLLGA